ncbi:hypothetical protein WN55_07569 [Dufourea novaeangliae]|uniref:Uncharacterized protein n=1 Tax=Dufourea novaeangliae TaxID=178035 RepID=A0A154PSI9_DUFNO|nr:hypothetical protein WN55_07569 [Dufourea novaeangliae]
MGSEIKNYNATNRVLRRSSRVSCVTWERVYAEVCGRKYDGNTYCAKVPSRGERMKGKRPFEDGRQTREKNNVQTIYRVLSIIVPNWDPRGDDNRGLRETLLTPVNTFFARSSSLGNTPL